MFTCEEGKTDGVRERKGINGAVISPSCYLSSSVFYLNLMGWNWDMPAIPGYREVGEIEKKVCIQVLCSKRMLEMMGEELRKWKRKEKDSKRTEKKKACLDSLFPCFSPPLPGSCAVEEEKHDVRDYRGWYIEHELRP